MSGRYACDGADDETGNVTDVYERSFVPVRPVTMAHYGTAAARTAAGNARLAHGTTVSSYLVRNQTVNPWR